ncbi:hypothetical protein U1Q18_036406 [Sarracenia purpurea var. burkii]
MWHSHAIASVSEMKDIVSSKSFSPLVNGNLAHILFVQPLWVGSIHELCCAAGWAVGEYVVIDLTRTVLAGKVQIVAFRTYLEGYKPPDEPVSEYQTIPLNKIEDFGVHCKQYYALDITYFKSSLDCHLLDLQWNKYWVNTLSSSPLLGNKDYVAGKISNLGNYLLDPSSSLRNSHQAPLIGNVGGFGDIGFLDPAILAVGKGTHPGGLNNTAGLEMRSNFPPSLNTLENEARV